MTPDATVSLPPPPPKFVTAALNQLIGALLRSPLHGLLSASSLVLAFRGAKTGKVYQFPVGYYGRQGATLYLIPLHGWWTNLRGNAPVTVWLKGISYPGVAEASRGDEPTAQALSELIRAAPNLIRLYKIPKDAQGQLEPERLSQVAHALPLVRIQLTA
jgi:hypothetical protein